MKPDMIHRDCPLCNSKNSVVKYAQNYNLSQLKEEFFSARRERESTVYEHNTFRKCNQCGLIYASPILNPELVEKLYKKSKFTYGEQAENLKKSYGTCLKMIEKYLKEKKVFLDIGCGNGFLLEEALAQGYKEVWGVEPSSDAANLASSKEIKKHIVVDILRDGQFKPKTFDVVCFFQTIDHVINPNEFLQICHTILKPGGILLCVSHDVEALSAKIMGEKSVIFDIEHTQLFSKDTISKICKRNGFESLEVFDVKNTYTFGYWLNAAPIPIMIKEPIGKISGALCLMNRDVTIKPGNFGFIAKKV